MSDDVHSRLGAIEGKVDLLIDFIKQGMERQDRRLDGHDTELGKVKKAINITRGWMLALPIVGGALAWVLGGKS